MTRPRLIDNAASGLGRMMPPRLSIDSNRFTLIDAGGNEKPHDKLSLDVVFIDLNAVVSKMYWGKEYQGKDSGDIPLCWSDNGSAPSAQASAPQSPKCIACTHNVIGSAISKFSGAKIKACVDMRKLAFILPGDPQNMIFLMTVKPGSFKNWVTYVNYLKAQKFTDGSSPDLSDIVTRLEFESQGVLKFSPVAPVPGDQNLLAQREAAWAKGTSGDIVGQNDVPWSGQLAPAQTQQLPPPVQPGAQVMQIPPPGMKFTQSSAAAMQPIPVDGLAPGPAARKPRRTKAQIEADNAAAAAGNGAPPGGQGPTTPQAPFMAQPNPQPARAPALPPQVQQATPPSPDAGQAADPLDDIPPFLRREQPVASPAPSGSGFGLATPQAADPAMLAAIDAAFKLPT